VYTRVPVPLRAHRTLTMLQQLVCRLLVPPVWPSARSDIDRWQDGRRRVNDVLVQLLDRFE
jgi:hypothetical protein